MRPYEGLLTAMITPFAADGSVNEEAAVALARHLLANGSHGLVVAGTTGEAATLTDDEQVRLVALIAAEVGSEGAMVAGAGSNDTRHAVELTERVVGAGAQAVLSVTPYYNKPNRRGIRRHFEEVARAAGGTPVILYNIPGRTAVNMPPDLLAELAQIDGMAGSSRPTPTSCSRSTGSRSSPATTTSSAAAWTWAAPAGSASPRTSSARRCGACTTSPTRARRSTPSWATSSPRCSSPPARRR